MNWKHGFTRLALVLALPWLAYWGYIYVHAASDAAHLRQVADAACVETPDDDGDPNTMSPGDRRCVWATNDYQSARRRVDDATAYGAILPALLLGAGGAGWFVFRGFVTRKSAPQ